MASVTMRQMLEAGVHFGHQTRYWNPKMRPYLYGARNGIHIINLEHTLPMLEEAMNFLGKVASNGGTILFVGTKRQVGKLMEEAAKRCGCPYVSHRWLGGMLTNFKTIRNSLNRLNELDEQLKDTGSSKLSKKELLSLERERQKLERGLAGIRDLGAPPDALFVVDVWREDIAVAEARKLGIPVVAVVDSNCSPDGVDYVIPGNDDAIRAVRLYAETAADAVIEGRQVRQIGAASESAAEYIEVDEQGRELTPERARAAEEQTARERADAGRGRRAAVAGEPGAEGEGKPKRRGPARPSVPVTKKAAPKTRAAKPAAKSSG
jgi:small subunit ribosomal protein S2